LKIPFLLEKYLPIWEYICPKCRKEVKANSRECPHCGEKYPLVLKIPPRFLKDPKKLEAYVHQNIFPRVDQKQRDYLTQYFTVLFSDVFESGDFSAWTSSGIDSSGGICEVISSPVKSGSYAAHIGHTSGQGYGFLTKTLQATTDPAYFRYYVNFVNLPTTGNFTISRMWNSTYGAVYARNVSISPNGTNFDISFGGSYGSGVSTQSLSINTWYCFECSCSDGTHANDGFVKFWLDGNLIINETGLLFVGINAIDNFQFRVGYIGAGDTNCEAYFDCVVVSDAPIGVESSATLQTVADSFSLTDAMLNNKTLIFNDVVAFSDSTSRNKTPLIISDEISFRDAGSTPSRVLITLDNLGLLENASINKVLAISDFAIIVELVEAGKGAKKTKLFLVLGDLAIQISDN
jgi:hypothetical protein